MAGTRKARVPMAEQIKLINECRQSGMTDADWCRENDIVVSTFYNWVSRCRKAAADQIRAGGADEKLDRYERENHYVWAAQTSTKKELVNARASVYISLG